MTSRTQRAMNRSMAAVDGAIGVRLLQTHTMVPKKRALPRTSSPNLSPIRMQAQSDDEDFDAVSFSGDEDDDEESIRPDVSSRVTVTLREMYIE